MALEDIFKGGNILTGLAIGAGVTLATRLVPGVAGAAGAVLRPVAKLAITTGVAAYEGVREVVAQGAETVNDLVAEARYEHQQATHRNSASASPPATEAANPASGTDTPKPHAPEQPTETFTAA